MTTLNDCSSMDSRFIREHGFYYHPRTKELINFVSDSPTRLKTVYKGKVKKVTGNITLTFPTTEKLNAFLPQTAYNRVTNAICLNPTTVKFLQNSEVFGIWANVKSPSKVTYKCLNTKKGFYCEKKHGYVSKSKISLAQSRQPVKPLIEAKRTYANMVRHN